MIELSLPWPPSVNSYWRHPTRGPLAGRHLISEAGRLFRNLVAVELRVNSKVQNLSGRLQIRIFAYPPDRRRRDLDNVLKATLDSLTYAGVIEDDSQFDRISIERMSPVKDGKMFLIISSIELT